MSTWKTWKAKRQAIKLGLDLRQIEAQAISCGLSKSQTLMLLSSVIADLHNYNEPPRNQTELQAVTGVELALLLQQGLVKVRMGNEEWEWCAA